jgi:hypothetical protein
MKCREPILQQLRLQLQRRLGCFYIVGENIFVFKAHLATCSDANFGFLVVTY